MYALSMSKSASIAPPRVIERVYTDEWKAFVRGKYGADPKLTWLETPVVVDNVSEQITAD